MEITGNLKQRTVASASILTLLPVAPAMAQEDEDVGWSSSRRTSSSDTLEDDMDANYINMRGFSDYIGYAGILCVVFFLIFFLVPKRHRRGIFFLALFVFFVLYFILKL